MTAPTTETPPYFALLSYNTYGKTSERDLAIAECRALACGADEACPEPSRRGGCAAPFLDERIMGLERPFSVRHAAFVSVIAETVAAAPTLEELCAALAASQVSAADFKIVVKKITPSLSSAGTAHPSPVLQAAIARALRGKPRLDQPKDLLLVVATPRRLWLGKVLERSEDRWRLHRVRPFPYIRSLPTRVARAVIGLVARAGDRIVDPCCGAGTFLVEAADMGITAEGFDINPKMVAAANANLQHFGLAPCAKAADARNLTGRWDAVVADPPYGHISNYEDSSHTPEILRNLPSLARRIAVVTASEQEPALAGDRLETIPLPVSRSLTRYIHVLRM